jgi:aryl-alcohol dehydrogenase-like predicted oxidoreductase
MKNKQLLLGTAQWGWTMSKEKAFQVLDAFYESGFRQIDCATNYPINKIETDFRAAEKIITQWVQANGINDLEVMMKIGSVSNLRTPDCNLNPSFLWMNVENYQRFLGQNLKTIMIHWDNREEEIEIEKTLKTLQVIHKQGFRVGLSGIKHPKIYAKLNEQIQLDFDIQIKHNVLQSDYERYSDFHQKARFIAYGTNAGGIKLDTSAYHKDSVLAVRGGDLTNENGRINALHSILAKANENKNRPPITSFFQVGMIYAFANTDIKSIITAPSSVEQWNSTFGFFKTLQMNDYQDIDFGY